MYLSTADSYIYLFLYSWILLYLCTADSYIYSCIYSFDSYTYSCVYGFDSDIYSCVYGFDSDIYSCIYSCAGGELFTECVIEESFTESDVIRFLIQILEGLAYLHERNIVHLDLKVNRVKKNMVHLDLKVIREKKCYTLTSM